MTTRSARFNWLFRLVWNLGMLLCIAGIYFGYTDFNKTLSGSDEAFQLALEAAGASTLYEFAVLLGFSRILLCLASIAGLWGIYQQNKRGAYLFAIAQTIAVVLPAFVLGLNGHFYYYVGITGFSSLLVAIIFLLASRGFNKNSDSQAVGPAN